MFFYGTPSFLGTFIVDIHPFSFQGNELSKISANCKEALEIKSKDRSGNRLENLILPESASLFCPWALFYNTDSNRWNQTPEKLFFLTMK